MLIEQATPIVEINDAEIDACGVRLLIKRIDLVHPVVSGNKWYKLKYNLQQAHQQGQQTLLSFGGAYSNHIHALAGAGRTEGFNTIGVIRGEPHQPLNATLQYATEQGMHLHYVSRADYRLKNTPQFIANLAERFGPFYLIPEGGSNALALAGVKEIIGGIDVPFDFVATACGTGGTLAGLIAGLQGEHQALGIAVLKGGDFINQEVALLLSQAGSAAYSNWKIETDYHFGGYAKTKPELLDFMAEFERQHAIPLEPVYTAKMFYALFDKIKHGDFARGSTIVALHTGGLQGRASMLASECC